MRKSNLRQVRLDERGRVDERRKGMTAAEVERWLRPNLGYEEYRRLPKSY